MVIPPDPHGLHRSRLPRDRSGITHRFKLGGLKGYVTVNEVDRDGRRVPAELFMWIAKEGSTLGVLANSVAMLTSICLQYGVPLQVLCAKFIGLRFEPEGHVEAKRGVKREIKYADSFLDYVFHWIALRYLGDAWILKTMGDKWVETHGADK